MKIGINANIQEGPWGGGNQVCRSLINFFDSSGHEVINNLKSSKIDLVLMIHPNKYLKICAYGIKEIEDYLTLHPNTLLLQRINTSDEGKGSDYENKQIMELNRLADYTVFISNFLKKLYINMGFDVAKPHCVIHNGADLSIFNSTGRANWNQSGKLKIVTHHWSTNFMKGYDIYERLDQLLDVGPYHNLFEFTYIGNIPNGIKFRNTKHIQPLQGKLLADELRRHHLYVTGARNEGAGMHHIEGMMCGLPVLFLRSGALPEYCSQYGIGFTLTDFHERLLEARKKIIELRKKVLKSPYSSKIMSEKYLTLIEKLVTDRQLAPKAKPKIFWVVKNIIVKRPLRKIENLSALIKKIKKAL